MKVIHLPYTYYPDPVGGTEAYVGSLVKHLRLLGVRGVIAAPADQTSEYSFAGVKVHRFAVSNHVESIYGLYGEGDPEAARQFGNIIDVEQPDVVHLHSFTPAVSLRLVKECKRRRIKIVFTYHTPTVSCHRGTLLRWGREICDGKLERNQCTRCVLHGLGMGMAPSKIIGSLPPMIGRGLGQLGLSGGLWTALRMSELIQLRQRVFRELMEEVDQVIAPCQWSKELLLSNGVLARKVIVSHHGLSQEATGNNHQPAPHSGLRIAFMGRIDSSKGADVLIKALQSMPDLDARLDLYGIVQGEQGGDHLRKLQELAGADARIRFLGAIAGDQVALQLRQYDVLAVPSRCLETGPLVVLEAFSAGTPVIGSNLGGIAELVEHGVDGLLIEPNSIAAWATTLRRCVEDQDLLPRLRAGIRPPRMMAAVAEEMFDVYQRLLATKSSSLTVAS